MKNADHEVTRKLAAFRLGDLDALDQVLPLLYDDLKRLARGRLRRERSGHTLNTTALVHETYLKLSAQYALRAEDRVQFLAAASNTMRRILVDYARARTRVKRGGGEMPISLEEVAGFLTSGEADEVLQFDRTLARLENVNSAGARVVELRFFAGLTEKEISDHSGVSERTVRRRWTAARAWLRKEMDAPQETP